MEKRMVRVLLGLLALFFCASQALAVPAAPSSLVLPPTPDVDGIYKLAWYSVSGCNYVLQESKDGGAWTTIYSGSNTYIYPPKRAVGSYTYQVKAVNSTGSSLWTPGARAVVVGATTAQTVPPTYLNVPASTGTSATKISFGGAALSASYVLEQSTDGGAFVPVYTGTNGYYYTVGLADGSTYGYRVKARVAGYADSNYYPATGSATLAVTLPAGAAACLGCHSTNPNVAAWSQSRHANVNQMPGPGVCDNCHNVNNVAGAAVAQISCQGCHGTGTVSHSVGAYSPVVALASCAKCHNSHVSASNSIASTIAANQHGAANSCANCHDSHSLAVNQPRVVDTTAVMTANCLTCHGAKTLAQLQATPFVDVIPQRFVTSRHANQSARAGFCSACHSDQGGQKNLAMGRMTKGELEAAYTATSVDVYALPVGSSTIVGVNKKTCATCHELHDMTLRGTGDVTSDDLGMTLPAGASTLAAKKVVYSQEFNLCTTCHQVGLAVTYAKESDKGALFNYQLSSDYAAENLISATTGTYDFSNLFYHDGASGNGRTFVDTHFGGTIAQHLVKFDGSATNMTLTGYNINPGNPDACSICHDPHTAGKMLSVATGQLDDINNVAISYAVGLGGFHANYLSDAQGHGCTPCHEGTEFVKKTLGGTPAGTVNVIGCRTCHNLAVANATPGTNNAAAFDDVRPFPVGYEYKFSATSAAAVTAAALGNSQICFECHKGRTAGKDVSTLADPATGTTNYAISYLHYAPSMAILFGDESKMVATYAFDGKTYAGRMTHYDGTTKLNCTDCHNVHTGADVMTTSTTCNGCHADTNPSLSKAALQARTQAFGARLLGAVYDDMADAYALKVSNPTAFNTFYEGTTEVDAINLPGVKGLRSMLNYMFETLAGNLTAQEEALISYIEVRQAYFPNKTVAHAATTWKVFNYEDGPADGLAHGHGGSWAHNSKFARQVQYDAIQKLGGDLTGLTRP